MLNEPTNGSLPLIAALRQPSVVDQSVVEAFGDNEEIAVKWAIAWSWDNRRVRGMTKTHAAELCGFKNSHLTNILAGRKYLPAQCINVWEEVVGNTAVSQTIERFRRRRALQLRREVGELVGEHLVPIQAVGGR